MKITDIRVKRTEDGRIKGLADIIIDNCFAVHDIRILYSYGKQGYFLSFPSRKVENGTYKDICHPIQQETREKIEKAVLDEFEKLLQE